MSFKLSSDARSWLLAALLGTASIGILFVLLGENKLPQPARGDAVNSALVLQPSSPPKTAGAEARKLPPHITPAIQRALPSDLTEALSLANRDVAAAFALLEKRPDRTSRENAATWLAENIAQIHPAMLPQLLRYLPHERQWQELIASVVSGHKFKDFELLKSILLDELTGPQKSYATYQIISACDVRGEPKTAADLHLAMPLSNLREQATYAVARAYTALPFSEATGWLKELRPQELRIAIRSLIAGYKARKDDLSLRALLPQVEDRTDRQIAIASTVSMLSNRNDHTGTQEFIDSLPEKDQDVARAQLIALAKHPLDRALALALELADPATRTSAVNSEVRKAFGRNSQETTQAALSFGGPGADLVLNALVSEWARHDIHALYDWIEAIRDQGKRDIACMQFTRILGSREPEAARAAANLIGEPSLRAKALHNIVDAPRR